MLHDPHVEVHVSMAIPALPPPPPALLEPIVPPSPYCPDDATLLPKPAGLVVPEPVVPDAPIDPPFPPV